MTGCSGNHPTSLGASLGGSACSAGSGPALLLELLLAAACGGVAWRGRTRAMRAQSLSWLGSSAPRSLATWQGGPRVGRRDSLDHMRLRCRGGCSCPRTGSSMKPFSNSPVARPYATHRRPAASCRRAPCLLGHQGEQRALSAQQRGLGLAGRRRGKADRRQKPRLPCRLATRRSAAGSGGAPRATWPHMASWRCGP
jgi:hypothetical protein